MWRLKMERFEEERQSKFNAALSYLEMMIDVRKSMINSRLNNDYSRWFELTQAYRNIMQPRFKPVEETEAEKLENDIRIAMNPATMNTLHPMKQNKRGHINYNEVRQLLNNYERFLGKLEHKFGLSLPNKDDARWAASN